MKTPFIEDFAQELLEKTYQHNLDAIRLLEIANQSILSEIKKRINMRQEIADKRDEEMFLKYKS